MGTLGLGTSSDRLRKMTAKTIALEDCGMAPSNDPRSVRFNGIMGPTNLDTIDESVW